ncbi:uncharacterized protein LOC143216995 isoform X1 [Lasioglossum baleicum]|uniref:uncharacterized protein LOC143216995 isoform X1 n=1 Tax=Lasioglossum baleicum TaxID=434251 RepID=UPI003FCDADF7
MRIVTRRRSPGPVAPGGGRSEYLIDGFYRNAVRTPNDYSALLRFTLASLKARLRIEPTGRATLVCPTHDQILSFLQILSELGSSGSKPIPEESNVFQLQQPRETHRRLRQAHLLVALLDPEDSANYSRRMTSTRATLVCPTHDQLLSFFMILSELGSSRFKTSSEESSTAVSQSQQPRETH